MSDPVDDLTHLARRLAELRVRLLRGDRAPRTHAQPTPEQAAARDELLRAERHDAMVMMATGPRGMTPLGASPAPLDLTLMHRIQQIHADLASLEAAVRARVAPAMGAPGPQRRIRRLLDLVPLTGGHPDVAEHLADQASLLNRRAAALLGDTEPWVRLTGIRCPVCDAVSLRLVADRDQVVCVNPVCTCRDFLCGCTDTPRTRHVWPATRWPELAKKAA